MIEAGGGSTMSLAHEITLRLRSHKRTGISTDERQAIAPQFGLVTGSARGVSDASMEHGGAGLG
jgi:hypothetical protein